MNNVIEFPNTVCPTCHTDLVCSIVHDTDDSGVMLNLSIEERAFTRYNRPLDIIRRWRRWKAEDYRKGQDYFSDNGDEAVVYYKDSNVYKVSYYYAAVAVINPGPITPDYITRYFRLDDLDQATEVWFDTDGNELDHAPHALSA